MKARNAKHIIETRNSKHEIRNKFKIRNSKIESSTESSMLSPKYLNNRFTSLFDFSDFRFQISVTEGGN